MPVERDAVIWGYRLLLGREPENEAAIQEHLTLDNVRALRTAFINSAEFRKRNGGCPLDSLADPSLEYERDCVVLIHLVKTAGTMLKELIAAHFQPQRICPALGMLHTYSPAALSAYDFYSGHFDLFSLRYIPRARKKTISVFRSPRERLVSFYYFCRMHPPKDFYTRLANAHTIEEFFQLPEVRRLPDVWNNYAMTFGADVLSKRWKDSERAKAGSFSDRDALLNSAVDNIRGLDAVGITEQMDKSVEMIFRMLKLPAPKVVSKKYTTDQLPDHDPTLKRIEKMSVSASLARSLDDLVCLDEQIYSEVLRLFESRCRGMTLAP